MVDLEGIEPTTRGLKDWPSCLISPVLPMNYRPKSILPKINGFVKRHNSEILRVTPVNSKI